MISMFDFLHTLFQCAKKAGQSALQFVSSTVMRIIHGGMGAFHSLGQCPNRGCVKCPEKSKKGEVDTVVEMDMVINDEEVND